MQFENWNLLFIISDADRYIHKIHYKAISYLYARRNKLLPFSVSSSVIIFTSLSVCRSLEHLIHLQICMHTYIFISFEKRCIFISDCVFYYCRTQNFTPIMRPGHKRLIGCGVEKAAKMNIRPTQPQKSAKNTYLGSWI